MCVCVCVRDAYIFTCVCVRSLILHSFFGDFLLLLLLLFVCVCVCVLCHWCFHAATVPKCVCALWYVCIFGCVFCVTCVCVHMFVFPDRCVCMCVWCCGRVMCCFGLVAETGVVIWALLEVMLFISAHTDPLSLLRSALEPDKPVLHKH